MSSLTLRRMSSKERQLMHTKLRTSTLCVRQHRRYRILAEVARGHPALAIADPVACSVDTVYLWVHRFNFSGFETFERPANTNGREVRRHRGVRGGSRAFARRSRFRRPGDDGGPGLHHQPITVLHQRVPRAGTVRRLRYPAPGSRAESAPSTIGRISLGVK
jgi:hypothetical protein